MIKRAIPLLFFLLLTVLCALLIVSNAERAFRGQRHLSLSAEKYAFTTPISRNRPPLESKGLAFRSWTTPLPTGEDLQLDCRFFLETLGTFKLNFVTAPQTLTLLLESEQGQDRLSLSAGDREIEHLDLPAGALSRRRVHTLHFTQAAEHLQIDLDGRQLLATPIPSASFTQLRLDNFHSDILLQSLVARSSSDIVEESFILLPSTGIRALVILAISAILIGLALVLNRRQLKPADALKKIPVVLFCFAPVWAGGLFPLQTPLLHWFGALVLGSLALLVLSAARPLSRRLGYRMVLPLLIAAAVLLFLINQTVVGFTTNVVFLVGFALVVVFSLLMLQRDAGKSSLDVLAFALLPATAGLVIRLISIDPSPAAALLFTSTVMFALALNAHRREINRFVPLMLAATLLVIGAAEIAARHSLLDTRWRPANVGADFAPDDELFYIPKQLMPEADWSYKGWISFRDSKPSLEPAPGVFRIVVMGASNAYGDKLEHNDASMSGQLEKILNARRPGRFEVLNAGVHGYEMFRVMLLFEQKVLAYRPDMLIAYLNLNDGLDMQGPYTLRELWKMKKQNRWSEVREQIQRAQSEAGAPAWIVSLQNLLRQSRLYNGLTRLITFQRSASMKAVAEKIGALKSVNPPEDYRRNLQRLIEVCREHDVQLVLADAFVHHEVTGPEGKNDKIRSIMREEAERNDVPFLGVHDIFVKRSDYETLVFDFDNVHLNHKGHRLVAELLAELLVEKKLID